jgi:Family of unknown function (DUF6510)
MSGGSPVADRGMPGMAGVTGTMDTSEEGLRLDGNAAAGVLVEIFVVEMTGAQVTCVQCGRTGPLGSLMLYGGQVGTILRCPTCDAVQLRIARVHGQYWMDMRGMSTMRITPAIPA